MNRFEPYVFLRDLASRWDVLAFIVVIGLIAFLGETSRGLFAPLSQLEVIAAVAGSVAFAGIRRAHHIPHAGGAVLSLVFTLTYATWAAKSERAGKLLVPDPGHSAVGPDSRFHFHYKSCFFMSLAPGQGARRRVRGDFRHIHQPGLEHGVQLLSVAAHRPDGTHRGGRILPAVAVDAILAAGGAVRHAGAGMEHDDVHVGRMVLRRRLRIDQRGAYHGGIAGRGLLHRARHRAEESRRHRLGDRHHADRDSAVRPAAVPAVGGLGGPLSRRTGPGRAGPGFLGVDHDAPLATDSSRDRGISRRGDAGPAARSSAAMRPSTHAPPAAETESGSAVGVADRGRGGARAVAHRRRCSSRTRPCARPCTCAAWRCSPCCGCSS